MVGLGQHGRCGLITVALMALVVAFVRASTQTTFTGSSTVVPKTFVVLDWGYWRTFAPFISAHMLASGITIARYRIVHPLVGWVAVAVAFLPLVTPPGLMTAVFMMWTAALSVTLLVHDLRSVRTAGPELSGVPPDPERSPPTAEPQPWFRSASISVAAAHNAQRDVGTPCPAGGRV